MRHCGGPAEEDLTDVSMGRRPSIEERPSGARWPCVPRFADGACRAALSAPPRSFGVSQKGRGVTSETGKLVQAYNTAWLEAPTGGLRLAQVPRAAVAHTPARVVTFWFPATLI